MEKAALKRTALNPLLCPGLDSNQHTSRRRHLKTVRLPVSPPGQLLKLIPPWQDPQLPKVLVATLFRCGSANLGGWDYSSKKFFCRRQQERRNADPQAEYA